MFKSILLVLPLACAVVAQLKQQQQYTTPVPILKQINRQNEDGSYSFGYEAADRSFKIETKYPNGEVYGKYGYVDDTGKVREVEYGASKRGFEPQGSDINVPPPTINNDNNNLSPLGPNEQDDGQYREDPSIYYKSDKYNIAPVKSSHHRIAPAQSHISHPQQRQQYQDQNYQSNYIPQQDAQPQYQQNYVPQTTPQYRQQSNFQRYQPVQQQQYYQQPANLFNGHPAEDININTGSYSLTYTG